MTHAVRTRQICWGALLLLVAGAAFAVWGYGAESSDRGDLESVGAGLGALVGLEDVSGWQIWVGRALVLAALALVVWYVVRRVRGQRPAAATTVPAGQRTAEQQPGPEPQFQPQPQPQGQPQPQPQSQPQVQWSTGGPQPAPPSPPMPSWGAETSSPTPLPVLPATPPADATREVIIPPLPPGWPRN